eukprot:gene9158-biopygen11055
MHTDPSLKPRTNETLSYLTGDWRIFQLRDGHRWSMDDMMTAYVALQEAATANAAAAPAAAAEPDPHHGIRSTLDIGCGIGSVLLMVAWGLKRQFQEQQHQQHQQQHQHQHPQHFAVTSLGLEAQQISHDLAVRSIRYNLGDDGHVQVSRGWADSDKFEAGAQLLSGPSSTEGGRLLLAAAGQPTAPGRCGCC